MNKMGNNLHIEIVQVVSKAYLIDGDGNECKYFRKNGETLGRGNYVVIWPPSFDAPRFDQNACFYGPYSYALMARLKVAEHVAAFASYSHNWGTADDHLPNTVAI